MMIRYLWKLNVSLTLSYSECLCFWPSCPSPFELPRCGIAQHGLRCINFGYQVTLESITYVLEKVPRIPWNWEKQNTASCVFSHNTSKEVALGSQQEPLKSLEQWLSVKLCGIMQENANAARTISTSYFICFNTNSVYGLEGFAWELWCFGT